jgi:hypothetical protein
MRSALPTASPRDLFLQRSSFLRISAVRSGRPQPCLAETKPLRERDLCEQEKASSPNQFGPASGPGDQRRMAALRRRAAGGSSLGLYLTCTLATLYRYDADIPRPACCVSQLARRIAPALIFVTRIFASQCADAPVLHSAAGFYETGSNVVDLKSAKEFREKVLESDHLWAVEFYREVCAA